MGHVNPNQTVQDRTDGARFVIYLSLLLPKKSNIIDPFFMLIINMKLIITFIKLSSIFILIVFSIFIRLTK